MVRGLYLGNGSGDIIPFERVLGGILKRHDLVAIWLKSHERTRV